MQQVSMQEMNTDEPLVEVSIVGNMLPEGMSYKGFPISTATVNRSWLCGNRSKGGIIPHLAGHFRATPHLAGHAGRAIAVGEKAQGGITIKAIIVSGNGSQTSS